MLGERVILGLLGKRVILVLLGGESSPRSA